MNTQVVSRETIKAVITSRFYSNLSKHMMMISLNERSIFFCAAAVAFNSLAVLFFEKDTLTRPFLLLLLLPGEAANDAVVISRRMDRVVANFFIFGYFQRRDAS